MHSEAPTDTTTCVRLLGPVDVVADGVARVVSGVRRKAVLAGLAMHAGDTVRTERLIDIVWGEDPPATAWNTLQRHISFLRRVLGTGIPVVTRSFGYMLAVAPDRVDAVRADRLIRHTVHDGADPVARLREALDLWRGHSLVDVATLPWFQEQAERLENLRLEGVTKLVELRLGRGEGSELVPELEGLIELHPLREEFHRQLMLALYHGGRQVEALAAFRRLRQILDDELGIEPSAPLRDLEVAILRQDPAIDHRALIRSGTTVGDEAPGAVSARSRPSDGTPTGSAHPLPADTGVFIGRAVELETIIARATATAGQGRVMSVHAIDGMPGVGKTALAAHVAHRLARHFVDRPVFVDLHGYTPGRTPADPAEVLAALMAADGFDPRHIPEGVEALSALWRQRMAGRRVLMVLDNAANSNQVVPLLPASAGSVVLVTSRRFLGDLPVDLATVPLDVLTPAEAGQMFVRLAPRAALDRDGVDVLVAHCGYLPLAIALMARVLVRHRTWTVGDLLAEMRARLITVTAEDRTVEAVFDLSYRNLPVDRQRVFRHLGLHPGTDIDVFAAAALAGVPLPEAIGHLDALHADNLLMEVGYHRYTMHDLIRRYARGLADADPARQREEARARLVDYYRDTATAADDRLARHTRPTPVADPAPATGAPDLADTTRALAWIRTERENLLACLAATNEPRQVVALTAGLTELLRRDGPWTEAIAAHTAAAQAAEQLGDDLSRANALAELATVHRLSSDYGSGARAAQQSLEVYRRLGSRLGEANALTRLGDVSRMVGDYQAAGQAFEQANAIYHELGDRLGRAGVLTFHGTVWYMLDEYAAAARSLRTALGLYRDLGDRLGEANALTYLGEVLRVAGDYPAAVDTLHEALRLHRDIEDRLGQANTLGYLGSVYSQTGNYESAGHVLKEALELYRDLGDRLGQTNVLDRLAQARLHAGNHPEATRAAQEALDLARDLDSRHGMANGMMRLGQILLATGDHQEADKALEAALDAYRSLADRSGEAEALNDLGVLHRRTGDLDRAREHHLRAAELAQQINSHWDEASALAGVGRCDVATGRISAAVEHLGAALAIFQRIGAAEAADVAADLDAASLLAGAGATVDLERVSEPGEL